MSKLDDILLQHGNYQSSKDSHIVKWKADIKNLMLEIVDEVPGFDTVNDPIIRSGNDGRFISRKIIRQEIDKL